MKKFYPRMIALTGILLLSGWALNATILQIQKKQPEQKLSCTDDPGDSLQVKPCPNSRAPKVKSAAGDSSNIDLNLPEQKPILAPQPVKHHPGKVPSLPGMGLYPFQVSAA